MSEIVEIHQSEIVDSRWQTRENGYSGPDFDEMVESISEFGIITPPGVFMNENGEWELIYGHRRVAAARKAKLEMIQVTELKGAQYAEDNDPALMDRYQQMVLADNLHHQGLTPLELARALQDIIQRQGLSQGDVGALYGKSQQWVSDKLRLLDLAAPVQEAVTGRAVEETVARAVARLPEEYQVPVLEYVQGRSSREATKVIGEIEAATDPGFWDLPEDKPIDAEHWNIKLMMDDHLDKMDKSLMPDALVAAHSSGRLLPPSRLSRYTVTGLDEWLIEHGRTCEECVLQEEGFYAGCRDEETQTCPLFMGPEDPVRLPIPDENLEDCDRCNDEHGWCTDLGCYINHVKAAKAATRAEGDEVQLDRMIEAQDRLRAFYDRQLQDDVDCDHWLAQACEHCKSFRGKDQRDQCGDEHLGRVHTMFWQSKRGVMVPRCTQFHLLDARRIPEIDEKAFEKILLAWLEAGIVNFHWLWEHEKTALDEIREMGLGKRRLCALVSYMMNQAVVNSWSHKATLINPVTGERETWKRRVKGERWKRVKDTTEESG